MQIASLVNVVSGHTSRHVGLTYCDGPIDGAHGLCFAHAYLFLRIVQKILFEESMTGTDH